MKIRAIVLWLTLAVGLGVVNWQIVQKEQLATNGQVVLLQLAPVDPRSLFQGDYMRLRYALVDQVAAPDRYVNGTMVIRLDANQVASYSRLYQPGAPLAANEHLLRYHVRDGNVWLGADSFFFEEGQAEIYQNARYGELRVAENGESILVGLRDNRFEQLGR
jgi:uncharacterized membrane-anchored protein